MREWLLSLNFEAALMEGADISRLAPIEVLEAAIGDGREFANGRQLPAWLGLAPAQHSSDGKHKSLSISKRGDRYLRALQNHAARAVLRSTQRDEKKTDVVRCKARRVAERRGHAKAIAAVANQLGGAEQRRQLSSGCREDADRMKQ